MAVIIRSGQDESIILGQLLIQDGNHLLLDHIYRYSVYYNFLGQPLALKGNLQQVE